MCGIAGIFGPSFSFKALEAMMSAQAHRGPNDHGLYVDPSNVGGLAHNRLSIIDLTSAGHQPMANAGGSVHVVFNGEIYNYLELREELKGYSFTSRTDTEVILAAYERWGEGCLDKFRGMFAILIWDSRHKRLFAARDRFGVKPLYYHSASCGTLSLASEIKGIHAGGVAKVPNPATWATYLATGLSDHSTETFWSGIETLAPGHSLTWQDGKIQIRRWYDLAERTGIEVDPSSAAKVREEYAALLEETIRLRFRSDVPVGINLSGGLDSSLLLALVDRLGSRGQTVTAYTFATGDENYDELPWVQQMLRKTGHPARTCLLNPADVPALAESVMLAQDEPFGGLPTLAYARLFEFAQSDKSVVLLDGQGMDEQWAGYDYYAKSGSASGQSPIVQGTTDRPVRPECLTPEFAALARPFAPDQPYPDALRNMQYRDIRYTKIPRALRFNDRISMRCSTELREPFLDHRLFELALRQPTERKILNGRQKVLLRELAADLIPAGVTEVPKRPMQTPQREWLRGPLRPWAKAQGEAANDVFGDWLQKGALDKAWREFDAGQSDNSFYIWQWVSLGLTATTIKGAVYA